MSKPVSFNNLAADRIVQHCRAGVSVNTAARYVGVPTSTAYSWLNKGRAGIEPYIEFAMNIEKALAEAEIHIIATMRMHATGNKEKGIPSDWRAARSLAEMLFPEKYGRKLNVTVEAGMRPANLPDFSQLTDAELEAIQTLREAKARLEVIEVKQLEGESGPGTNSSSDGRGDIQDVAERTRSDEG